MKSFLYSLAISLALTAPAMAQGASIQDPGRVVGTFTSQEMDSFLGAVGLPYTMEKVEDGSRSYVVELAPGGPHLYFFTAACADAFKEQCYGLDVAAFFQTPAQYRSAAAMNDFNASASFPKLILIDNGMTVLTRYLISDGGILRSNMYENIGVFVSMADALFQTYSKAGASGLSLVEQQAGTPAAAFGDKSGIADYKARISGLQIQGDDPRALRGSFSFAPAN